MWLQNLLTAQNCIIRSNSQNTVKYVIITIRRIIRLRRMTHPWYKRCTYGIFGREITIHTVIHGVYIRFWPTQYVRSYMVCIRYVYIQFWPCFAFPQSPLPPCYTRTHTHTHIHTRTHTRTHIHTYPRTHIHTHTHTHANTHTRTRGHLCTTQSLNHQPRCG